MTATREPSIAAPPALSFGEQLYATIAGRRDNAGKITKEQWIATANELFVVLSAAQKRTRKPKGAPRARNPLWDALAIACDFDLATITRIPAKEIGVALADILAASPDVTPDEIHRRVKGYRNKYPGIAYSPFAIAKHWPEFGTAKQKPGASRNIYVEPPSEWREMAARRWPDALEWGNPHDFSSMAWKDVSTSLRPEILKLFEHEPAGRQ